MLEGTRASDLFARYVQSPPANVEALKCLAFFALQPPLRSYLMEEGDNIVRPLVATMRNSQSEDELQWAAMALYYLASTCTPFLSSNSGFIPLILY